MDSEIKSFISLIREKTGIEFSVFDTSGKFLAGNGDIEQVVPCDFTGIKSEPKLNKTLFLIKYKGRPIIGAIEGVDEIIKNYAFLIGELAESSFIKEAELSRTEFCRAILSGEASHTQISRYMRKFKMKDQPAFVMVISISGERKDDVKTVLETYGEEGSDFVLDIGDDHLAFVKFFGEDGDGYQSSTEYAEFIKQSVYEETGASVKIAIGGTVNTVSELSSSFNQALTTVRMRDAVNSKGEIHSFKEYMLIKMLEDLPKHKLNEYLQMLLNSGAKGIFADEEMTNTAEEFLENSLNISETSRNLYLHRNTLTYRLDKIEKETGLNIRKFSDAVTFRLITVLSKLVK